LDEFQRRLPDLFENSFRLLPLTPLGAREAIVRPLNRAGVPFDEGLITRLIDELTEFEFDSARLQVSCCEIYRQGREKQHEGLRLTCADLDEVKSSSGGELRGIYRRYIKNAIAKIPPNLHLGSRVLLDKLITAKGTKYAVGVDELRSEFGTGIPLDDTLTALSEQRLIRKDERGGHFWYELVHECLVEEIIEWMKQDETYSGVRFVRNLIIEHSRDDRFRTHPTMLLTAAHLQSVEPLRHLLQLNDIQIEYLVRSAIGARSPESVYWAGRYGRTGSSSCLKDISMTNRCLAQPGRRRGGPCSKSMPESAGICLALALDPGVDSALRRTHATPSWHWRCRTIWRPSATGPASGVARRSSRIASMPSTPRENSTANSAACSAGLPVNGWRKPHAKGASVSAVDSSCAAPLAA